MSYQKNSITSVLILSFLIFTSCGVKDAIDESIDALECANLIEKLSDDNENCTDTIADLDKIERSCGEFLSTESKERIAFIRANCTDN